MRPKRQERRTSAPSPRGAENATSAQIAQTLPCSLKPASSCRKKYDGFAAMSPELVRRITTPANPAAKAHQLTYEQALVAGRKGRPRCEGNCNDAVFAT